VARGEDIFTFHPATLGAETSGTYDATPMLDGSAFGLAGLIIGGIHYVETTSEGSAAATTSASPVTQPARVTEDADQLAAISEPALDADAADMVMRTTTTPTRVNRWAPALTDPRDLNAAPAIAPRTIDKGPVDAFFAGPTKWARAEQPLYASQLLGERSHRAIDTVIDQLMDSLGQFADRRFS
jgi:hypothetical protein